MISHLNRDIQIRKKIQMCQINSKNDDFEKNKLPPNLRTLVEFRIHFLQVFHFFTFFATGTITDD